MIEQEFTVSFLGWYANLCRTNLVDAAKRRLLIAHLKQDHYSCTLITIITGRMNL